MKHRMIMLSVISLFIWSCGADQTKFADKDYFYIEYIDSGEHESYFDLRPIRFLTDEEAVEVARERGEAMLDTDEDGNEEYSVPNGYYIDDKDTNVRSYVMKEDVLITSWAYSEAEGMHTLVYNGINNFLEFYQKRDGDYRNIPFIIEIRGSDIISIYEQYVP